MANPYGRQVIAWRILFPKTVQVKMAAAIAWREVPATKPCTSLSSISFGPERVCTEWVFRMADGVLERWKSINDNAVRVMETKGRSLDAEVAVLHFEIKQQ